MRKMSLRKPTISKSGFLNDSPLLIFFTIIFMSMHQGKFVDLVFGSSTIQVPSSQQSASNSALNNQQMNGPSPSNSNNATPQVSLLSASLMANPSQISNSAVISPQQQQMLLQPLLDSTSSPIYQQQQQQQQQQHEPQLSSSNNKPRYRTMYACEDRQMIIDCENGYRINLIRANYGRFSITQCNEQGHTDFSTDCMSPITFRVMRDRCQDKQKCSVNATSSIFGDRCPKTRKYLEVHFLCRPEVIEKVDLRNLPPSPNLNNQFNPRVVSDSSRGTTLILPPNYQSQNNYAQPQQTQAQPQSHHYSHHHHQQQQQQQVYNNNGQLLNTQLQDDGTSMMLSTPSNENQQLDRQNRFQPIPVDQNVAYKQSPQQQQQQIMTVINSEIITQSEASQQQANTNYQKQTFLSQPYQYVVSLRHLHSLNMSNPRCLFWDQSERQWVERAGQVIDTNQTHTTCAFDSAGSYMLAMDHHSNQSPSGSSVVTSQSQQALSSSISQGENFAPSIVAPSSTLSATSQILYGNNMLIAQQAAPATSSSSANVLTMSNAPSTVSTSGSALITNGSSLTSNESNQTISSSLMRFFSIFGYIIVIMFVALALLTIAFVTTTSSVAGRRRWTAGCMLKRLGNNLMPQFGPFSQSHAHHHHHPHVHHHHTHHRSGSSSNSSAASKSVYGSKQSAVSRNGGVSLLDEHCPALGTLSDGGNKDLLVINNQTGHQFIYSPAASTTTTAVPVSKITSSPSSHILTSSHQGNMHHHTLQHSNHHHNQHQHQLHNSNSNNNNTISNHHTNDLQHLTNQRQLYSSTNAAGTLSSLNATSGQSNNYYYGLFPQFMQQNHHHQQQQQQQNHFHHHNQSLPASQEHQIHHHQIVNSQQQNQQQQHNLISPIVSATSQRKSHLNLNSSLSERLGAGVSSQVQASPQAMREHIYECVDDENKNHIIRSFYHLV